jgi:hypothetical protein
VAPGAAGFPLLAADIVTATTNAVISANIVAKTSRSQGGSLPAWLGEYLTLSSGAQPFPPLDRFALARADAL